MEPRREEMPVLTMHVAVLLYPGCIFFEIALAAETLAGHCTLSYYTPDGEPHRASNGATLVPAGDLSALKSASLQAVLVPGGDPRSLMLPVPRASEALRAQADAGALVAGICAGNLVMAGAGLLVGRRGTHNYTAEHAPPEKVAATRHFWDGMQFVRADLVQDGRLITAQPWAYRPYAAAVARTLGVLDEREARALETYVVRRSCGDGPGSAGV